MLAGEMSRGVAEQDGAEQDILDLPEPIEERRGPWAPRSPVPRAPREDQFDHKAWSRELDDLLQRPLTKPAKERADGRSDGGGVGRPGSRSGSAPVPLSQDHRLPVATARRPSTWIRLIVLCLSGAVMGGIIGGAAYALASPEAVAWFTGAGDFLGRLQIAVSR